MLQHLLIRDFAVIENTEIEFGHGLNIVTGETGAGKSILVEAVSLALGSRADSSFVRHGKDKAIIQLQAELDGTEHIITREISASGRNLCRLDGQLVTLGEVAALAGKLADIHGQYDNQLLQNPDHHLHIVDRYMREEIDPLQEDFVRAYHAYKEKREALKTLLKTQEENAKKADFLRFQSQEIESASLVPGEDEALAERISLLENSEKVYAATESAYTLLDGDGPSVVRSLGMAEQSLSPVTPWSADLAAAQSCMTEVLYDLQDAAETIRDVRDSLTFSPGELDEAIARQARIDDLKKKYGGTIQEILNYRNTIDEQLLSVDHFDEVRDALKKETSALRRVLMEKATALTDARKQSAAALSSSIEKELHDLNFPDARLEFHLSDAPAITELGKDQCEILLTTNRGEPMKPLVRVASGGEISRIMLAIKNITAGTDHVPTMIFDEIDTGISGKTASVVGAKLKEIARDHQIICITHLPQIASRGDANYRIIKSTSDTETFTSVLPLSEEALVEEIARLMAGEAITDTARRNARELLKWK